MRNSICFTGIGCWNIFTPLLIIQQFLLIFCCCSPLCCVVSFNVIFSVSFLLLLLLLFFLFWIKTEAKRKIIEFLLLDDCWKKNWIPYFQKITDAFTKNSFVWFIISKCHCLSRLCEMCKWFLCCSKRKKREQILRNSTTISFMVHRVHSLVHQHSNDLPPM